MKSSDVSLSLCKFGYCETYETPTTLHPSFGLMAKTLSAGGGDYPHSQIICCGICGDTWRSLINSVSVLHATTPKDVIHTRILVRVRVMLHDPSHSPAVISESLFQTM